MIVDVFVGGLPSVKSISCSKYNVIALGVSLASILLYLILMSIHIYFFLLSLAFT
jgi:hypothetical protein